MRFVGLAAVIGAACAPAMAATPWTVKPEWVRAHETFLAGDALNGRGSATHDEAVAAAYVASQFEGYGLKPAPGMTGYLQTAKIVRTRLTGPVTLAAAGKPLDGLTLLFGAQGDVEGRPVVVASGKVEDLPKGADVVLLPGYAGKAAAAYYAARDKGIRLLIVPDSASIQKSWGQLGRTPRLPTYLAESPPKAETAFGALPAATIAAIARSGDPLHLTLPVSRDEVETTNAVGYLPGSDPKTGVILLSAHLDHLGKTGDGPVMHGANDDAAGTTGVLELAHALGAGGGYRRGILFVCYGSEEIGGYGSRYFGAHPPVPLDRIAANIEFEMIGAQDPKLPKGALMMTGYDRSDLGAALRAHGGLVAPDPYPDEHFFERSDNYSLALKGVVAHTLSGWAVVPTYHQPTDTIANLDIGYMTAAIQSLVEPVRWLAGSDFRPRWTGKGQPKE